MIIEFSGEQRYNQSMKYNPMLHTMIVVVCMLMAGCGPAQTPRPDTPVPTETPLPLSGVRVSTLAPPASNTPLPATHTPIPPTAALEPTATPGCVLSAAFIADVTIPDGTAVVPGSQFVKTWRIRNSGTCDWGSGYTAVFVEGDQLGGPGIVRIEPTDAGRTRDVSITLKAPSQPGAYRGKWQLRAPGGPVLTGLTVSIVVQATPTPTGPPTATPKPTPVPTFAATIDSFVGLWAVDIGMRGFATNTQRLQQLQITKKSGAQLQISPETAFGSPYEFGIAAITTVSYAGGPRLEWAFEHPNLGTVRFTMTINKLCNARVRLRYPGFEGTFIMYQPQCKLPGEED